MFVKLIVFLSFLFIQFNTKAQLPYKLLDGREHRYCESCQSFIQSKPEEVLFGIDINEAGEVYFSMNDKTWFDKIFPNDSYGISVDLVSKDRYACNKDIEDFDLPKGKMLFPVYRPVLLKNNKSFSEESLFVKIGDVPPASKSKELEGNLVILNGNYICYYTNFLNIDRSAWKLLPMGIYTDTLLNIEDIVSDAGYLTLNLSKKIQVEIPFSKSSAVFPPEYLQKLYDSLNLQNYRIRNLEIRAYSSVEGATAANKVLMEKRAAAMIDALGKFKPAKERIQLLAMENWLEFSKDIEGTAFEELNGLSKLSIKQKLSDPVLIKRIEPILSKHRKVIARFFLEQHSSKESIPDTAIAGAFYKAVAIKDITAARQIQKELMERIIDKTLPSAYIDRLEAPRTKDFSAVMSDREVYKLMLRTTNEYEALQNFLALKKIDPQNGHISYNICVLRFFAWQYAGDTIARRVLLKEINELFRQGIDTNLVKRMRINYYILKSEDQLKMLNYDGKDSSVTAIRNLYEGLPLTDEDIYSMARYFTYYSHSEWAEEIIEPRVGSIDISEDLVFYYLNLLFFHPSSYPAEGFTQACLNAANLNTKRFCRFFLPNHRGGAGMQLLDDDTIKFYYCENCK